MKMSLAQIFKTGYKMPAALFFKKPHVVDQGSRSDAGQIPAIKLPYKVNHH